MPSAAETACTWRSGYDIRVQGKVFFVTGLYKAWKGPGAVCDHRLVNEELGCY
jgi:hypothetical protein